MIGPSIAVLPFHNLSSEAEQDYFADGVVEDIITALSRFKHVRGRRPQLIVRLQGQGGRRARSRRRSSASATCSKAACAARGDRVRVTAQLIDADTGAHIWAEKFDGNLADIFDVQDTITESVVGLIEPQIRKTEIERTRRKRPDSLDAYDLMLRAGPLVLGPDREFYTEAVDLLHRAIALDPGYALAYALCGWAHEKRLHVQRSGARGHRRQGAGDRDVRKGARPRARRRGGSGDCRMDRLSARTRLRARRVAGRPRRRAQPKSPHCAELCQPLLRGSRAPRTLCRPQPAGIAAQSGCSRCLLDADKSRDRGTSPWGCRRGNRLVPEGDCHQ